METPGRAVALVEYCSGFIYFASENPFFDPWESQVGGGGPYLWTNDDLYSFDETPWLEENIAFLRKSLNFDTMYAALQRAAERLRDEPEEQLAQKAVGDAVTNRELVEHRQQELVLLLSCYQMQSLGWTV